MYIFQVVNHSNHQCPGTLGTPWDITSKQLENSCYPQFSWFFPSDPKNPIRAVFFQRPPAVACLAWIPSAKSRWKLWDLVAPRPPIGDSPIFGIVGVDISMYSLTFGTTKMS